MIDCNYFLRILNWVELRGYGLMDGGYFLKSYRYF